ncbi:unnamed protein product, partial [Symbiodinium sp. KB8]
MSASLAKKLEGPAALGEPGVAERSDVPAQGRSSAASPQISRAELLKQAMEASTTAVDFLCLVQPHSEEDPAPCPASPLGKGSNAASAHPNRFAADVFFVLRLVEGLEHPDFHEVCSIVGGAGGRRAATESVLTWGSPLPDVSSSPAAAEVLVLLQAGQDRATGMPDECSASVTSQASLPGGHGLPSTRQPVGQDQRGETASDPFTPPCPTPTARGQAAKFLLQASSS